MQTIFVMIKTELGRAYEVAEGVADIDGVSEVHSVSGQYDLLAKCVIEPQRDVGHFVTETLQKVPGVKDTFTLIAFKAFQ